MKANYPLTGVVDVVFRAYSDSKIGGKEYKKGEPISYISETQVDITFAGLPKSANDVQTLLSHNNTFPDTVKIQTKVFKDAILRLFGVKIKESVIYIPKTIREISNSSGEIYIDNNIQNVFVYDVTMSPVESFSVSSEIGLISGLNPDEEFFIDYKKEVTDFHGYGLRSEGMPYITIELKGTLKGKGVENSFYIEIPRTKLDMSPAMSFSNESFSATELIFKIIQDKNINGINIYLY